jgi:hypothetical protein
VLTETEVDQLLARIKALEDRQREFDLELRAALLSVVAVIERRHKIGKYKPVEPEELFRFRE